MKVAKSILLINAGKHFAWNEKLAFDMMREIEEHCGGPPAGAQFLVLDGHQLILEYMPFSREATEYALVVEGYLDDTQ